MVIAVLAPGVPSWNLAPAVPSSSISVAVTVGAGRALPQFGQR
jgi:hypothetical protein